MNKNEIMLKFNKPICLLSHTSCLSSYGCQFSVVKNFNESSAKHNILVNH